MELLVDNKFIQVYDWLEYKYFKCHTGQWLQ